MAHSAIVDGCEAGWVPDRTTVELWGAAIAKPRLNEAEPWLRVEGNNDYERGRQPRASFIDRDGSLSIGQTALLQ